eukprot:TRINITY_DN8923_c2_g1_i1.p1 TRINITY_DN8923_c2_g1~~TRINITY_DN8923_c2_g1_i1.p1  ORF type:complete len:508 (+),score=62.76 TRINITY_DN8923_c2_g1_i1:81-1526(+)
MSTSSETNPFMVDIPLIERRGKIQPGTGFSMREWTEMAVNSKKPTMRTFSRGEIERHNKRGDMWMVIKGRVYDVTLFGSYHPGGEDVLLPCAGKDATLMYNKYHPWVAVEAMMGNFCIGTFDPRLTYEAPPPYSISAPKSSFSMKKAVPEKVPKIPYTKGELLTPEMVAGRNTESECWVTLHGKAYDITNFLDKHPGGDQILLKYAGKDASIEFDRYHSVSARMQLPEYYIGDMVKPTSLTPNFLSSTAPSYGARGRGKLEGPRSKLTLKLLSKDDISHDTALFKMKAPEDMSVPLCGHIKIFDKTGSTRSYTPIKDGQELHFIVKNYQRGLSAFIHGLEAGDEVGVSPPIAPPAFSIEGITQFVVMAAGTGIAPFIKLLTLLKDEPELSGWFIVSNKTRADILLGDFLSLPNLKVRHHITQEDAPAEPGFVTGRVDSSCAEFLPTPTAATLSFVCGTPSFNDHGKVLLEKIGFQDVVVLA